jgi:drug/metabolite transporter (DMT)-like permease
MEDCHATRKPIYFLAFVVARNDNWSKHIFWRRDFMNFYGKRSISWLIKILLWVIMILGTVVLVLSIYYSFTDQNPLLSTNYKMIFYTLIFIGCLCVYSLFYLVQRILSTFVAQVPFVWANVKRLKTISIIMLVISLVYIVNIISNPDIGTLQIISIDSKGVHTDLEFVVFIFCSLAFYVVAKIFEQAVKTKEENDLTI